MTKFKHEVPMGTRGERVSVVMGSRSDWEPCMQHACEMLDKLGISFEAGVVSAHRTPERMDQYAKEAAGRGVKVIIAGAGGAAHLPGMIAGKTTLPVLGVPVKSSTLAGVDSLLSIIQMPPGVPVATFGIGQSGAKNAALHAARDLARHDREIRAALLAFIEKQSAEVPLTPYEE